MSENPSKISVSSTAAPSEWNVQNSSSMVSPEDIRLVRQTGLDAYTKATEMNVLIKASEATGNYVQIQAQFGCCPVLVGNDQQPIFLYHLVEAIDEFVDYERLHEEFPTLSAAQINGALSFLRKLAQYNSRGVDIDALEEESHAEEHEFIEEIRHALNNKGLSRVLHSD